MNNYRTEFCELANPYFIPKKHKKETTAKQKRKAKKLRNIRKYK